MTLRRGDTLGPKRRSAATSKRREAMQLMDALTLSASIKCITYGFGGINDDGPVLIYDLVIVLIDDDIRTGWPKKLHTILLSTSLTDFHNSFTDVISWKFAIKNY